MRRLRSRRLLAIVLCLLDAPTFAQVTQNVPMGIYQDQVAGWINVKSYGATGNGVTDDTAALQRALTAGANRVVVIPAGTYITRPIFTASGTTLAFTPGSKLMAKSGYGTNDRLLNVLDVSNVSIVGNNATIQMRKADYVTGEQRHCLSINSSTDVRVYDLTLKDSGGDGVYIGADDTGGSYSARVLVSGVHADNNRRQGASIASCDSCTIRDSSFTNTTGTDPQYGIDVEPNTADTHSAMRGIRILNCRTSGNAGGGVQVVPDALNSTGGVFDVAVDGLTSDTDGAALGGGGEAFGVRVSATTSGAWANSVPGQVLIKNITINNPYASGIALENLAAASSPRVTIRDVAIFNVNRGATSNNDYQVGLWIGSLGSQVSGNFEAHNVRVYDTRGTPATYAAAYIKDSTPTFTNYLLEDVWGYGFTPTGRMLVKLGTSTSMTITYSQPLLNELAFSATIGALHDFIGQQVAVTASGVAPLPAAAAVIGQPWKFRMVNDATFQIRPVTGEKILQYGDSTADAGHTLGDMVLNYAGDYVELVAVAANTWQVRFATLRVNRPQQAVQPPPQEYWDVALPSGARTWKTGAIVHNATLAAGTPSGWYRLTNGAGNVLDTDWLELPPVSAEVTRASRSASLTAASFIFATVLPSAFKFTKVDGMISGASGGGGGSSVITLSDGTNTCTATLSCTTSVGSVGTSTPYTVAAGAGTGCSYAAGATVTATVTTAGCTTTQPTIMTTFIGVWK